MADENEINEVVQLLRLADNAEACRRVQKFIRTNGAAGLLPAAREAAKAIDDKAGSPRAIVDPWGYCLGIVNHDIARAVALHPYLSLFENALRVRVDRHLSRVCSTTWYLTPQRWLPTWLIASWTTKDVYRNIQDRSGGDEGGPYPLKPFSSGIAFTTELTLGGLIALAREIHTKYPRALFPPAGAQVYSTQAVRHRLGTISEARDAVAHHRGIRKASHEDAHKTLCEFLGGMEFDHDKAVRRLMAKVEEVHGF